MTKEQEDIYSGKLCPYCKKETEYKDSSIIYGKSYGMVYICSTCDAYVGVHKGTDKALGRLADKKLRELKKEKDMLQLLPLKESMFKKKFLFKFL